MNAIRQHFHKLLALLLLTTAAATVLAIYYEVPLPFQKRVSAKVDGYVCPMHPDVHAQAPGKCSKCGMALVARVAGEDQSQSSANAAAGCDHGSTAAGAGSLSHDGCAKEESGCCAKKPTAAARFILPPGHPPIAGYTVATNAPAK